MQFPSEWGRLWRFIKGSAMKLKETTIDQRLMAGLLSVIVFFYGWLVLGEVGNKFEQLCNLPKSSLMETTILGVYVFLATIGCALSVLHLLSMLKFRK